MIINHEFYSDIRLLIENLRNAKDKIVSENIEEAMDFSSAYTEILLQIKFYLAQINFDNLNEDMLIEVERIKSQVDILLE